MIVWNTTREKSDFDSSYSSYFYTYSATMSDGFTDGTSWANGDTTTYIGSYSKEQIYDSTSRRTSVTYEEASETGSTSFTIPSQTGAEESDTIETVESYTRSFSVLNQLSIEEELGSTSSSFQQTVNGTSTDSSSSTWEEGSPNYYTTETSSFSSALVVTRSFTASDVAYTSGLNSDGETILSTTSITVNQTSSGTTYTELPYTHLLEITSATEFISHPREIGTIIRAESTDWLWSLTAVPSFPAAFDSSLYLITDIAVSFTQATFWPMIIGVEQSYFTYDTPSTLTVSYPGDTTEFTTVTIDPDTITLTLTVTRGNSFPRETTSQTRNSTSLRTGAFTGEMLGDSLSFETAGTTLSSNIFSVPSTTLRTIIFGTELDSSTTQITAETVVLQTLNYTTGADPFLIYRISASGSTDSVSGNAHTEASFSSTAFQEATIISLVSPIAYVPSFLPQAEIFQKVPKHGGMKTPNAVLQTAAAGSNLNFPSTIYYPFASSLQQNAVTPVPLNTSVNEQDTNKTILITSSHQDELGTWTYSDISYTDVTGWEYSWSYFTLSFTRETSRTELSLGETITITDSTTGSGVFSTQGTASGEFWQRGAIDTYVVPFGGFSPVSTADEIALYFPGGAKATLYDTSGGSSTLSSYRSQLQTATLYGNILVERSLVLISTSTQNGGIPIVSFSRLDGE